MSLATMKKRFTRQTPGNADPAQAFGSEQQLMAEFQRQEYVQPAARPVSVLESIRERLSSRTARPHETDAPVYSADTYSHESAPDLGWEAAFDPDAAPREPAEPTAAPSAQDRFEQFRQTVYASPVRPSPVYEEISFGGAPKRENSYRKPVYEEITFTAPQPRSAPVAAAPIYEDLTPGARSAPAPAYAPEAPEAAFYSEEAAPEAYEPIPAPAPKAVRASDFQYAFWSGSILAGVALTLFSFIYACVM